MRRHAVILACVLSAANIVCTEKLWLPASGLDAGSIFSDGGADSGDTGSGGGGMNRDGSFGQGGHGGPNGSGGRNGQSSCQGSVKLPLQKTRLVFSVGKNASMTRPFGNNGATRLSAIQQVLQSVISDNFNAVNFGYQDFPGPSTSCTAGAGCCSGAFVPPDSTTWSAIQGYLQCGQPPATKGCASSTDSRPIGAALQAALPLFAMGEAADHELVLLVDGEPSCAGTDPTRACEAATIARSDLSTRVAVTTFVVGVGQDAANSACLDDLALQGNRPLITANDPQQLSDAIRSIVNMAAQASCVISLMPPVEPSTVRLYLNGREIPSFGPDGWDFASGPILKIQVKGSSCRDLQRMTESQIQVLACPPSP